MERLKKVKDIERKLDSHRKNVSIKIIKAQRKKAVTIHITLGRKCK